MQAYPLWFIVPYLVGRYLCMKREWKFSKVLLVLIVLAAFGLPYQLSLLNPYVRIAAAATLQKAAEVFLGFAWTCSVAGIYFALAFSRGWER